MGRRPNLFDEVIQKKVIGNDRLISCRPADLLEPELDRMKGEGLANIRNEEDLLSYVLFPQTADDFFRLRES